MRLLALCLLLLTAASAFAESSDGLRLYSTRGAFADVAAGLEDAIVNRGYVVDHKGFIGGMLARTAQDAGTGGSPYVDAQYFIFCSAVLSGRMMAAEPRNIVYCPYVVFAYEMKSAPGTVHLGYRELNETGSDTSKEAIRAINIMLDEVVREAAQ